MCLTLFIFSLNDNNNFSSIIIINNDKAVKKNNIKNNYKTKDNTITIKKVKSKQKIGINCNNKKNNNYYYNEINNNKTFSNSN